MPLPLSRRLLALLLLVALLAGAVLWLWQRVPPAVGTAHAPKPAAAINPKGNPGANPFTPVRSTAKLRLDPTTNELPDHRTAKEQKDAVVKRWGDYLQAEKARVGASVFDPAVQRWVARPRIKELIEEWKALEQAWPERSEEQRVEQLPHIEAMWREAIGELAAELAAVGHPAELPPR